MEITQKKIIILEIEKEKFDSLMFYLDHGIKRIYLSETDARKAKDLYDSIKHAGNKRIREGK